ncbi:MAG TPA: cache domain-containing protein, partial [Motiliproteus sp.]
YLPLVATPRALPTERVAEDRGMVIHVVYPLVTSYGEVFAFLSAGVLLNGNFQFVDSLRDLVYAKGSLVEDSLGTVTVFLGDVRISTNVPSRLDAPGRRALGTRVSREVSERVLVRGENWIDRAFVVSEWFVSAYEPIVDVNGDRVGILYAGFLETPFKQSYFQALQWLVGLFVAVTLLCVLLAVLGAKAIFRPIEAMAKVIREVREGHDLRIGKLDSRDEIAELALRFDDMLDQLQLQREQIQSAAVVLEQKVEERTSELQQKTRDLQENLDLLNRTRQQLVAKEKLAAIGELTAGIAHEINNPTAVILGHMDLLMQDLGELGEPVRGDADMIVQQVYRIRAIINNLLQYSRPNDYVSKLAPVDLNRVVNDSLALVRHDLERKAAQVKLDLRASQLVGGNHQQFQQVLINLLVNAMNAIDPQGRLTIRTRDWFDSGVLLMVRDNGCGIAAETLPRIFDPFFSQTKGGTGLGLSVSYGILQRFGAEIEVRSRPGVGSAFFIWFRRNPPQDQEGDALIESIT